MPFEENAKCVVLYECDLTEIEKSCAIVKFPKLAIENRVQNSSIFLFFR